MEDLAARGHVRGTDLEPYAVKLQVTPSGFTSECSCPAFPKINGHCKHVAALLISCRDQVRPKQPRLDLAPAGTNGASHGIHGVTAMGAGGGGGLGGGGGGGHDRPGHDRSHGNDPEGMGGSSRRARRRARKLAAQRAGGVPPIGGSMGAAPRAVRASRLVIVVNAVNAVNAPIDPLPASMPGCPSRCRLRRSRSSTACRSARVR
ncbi:SWIM zinc finger family protein [Labilithrix luteola]|uniref:SWIM zinc finger family protein n=1 Tax=Labilithrix luteola TaxID=1391654 RepID=UPI003B839676